MLLLLDDDVDEPSEGSDAEATTISARVNDSTSVLTMAFMLPSLHARSRSSDTRCLRGDGIPVLCWCVGLALIF